jgi:hypothetical protein
VGLGGTVDFIKGFLIILNPDSEILLS